MTAALIAAPGLFYPFAVGLVAVVNPCGFPLLPAYLGLAADHPRGGRGALALRSERALLAAVAVTVGFLCVFGVIGLLVELGFAAFYANAANAAAWFMMAMGAAMLAAGVTVLCHRPLRVPLPRFYFKIGLRRPGALVGFGVSYAVASLGCSWPLFLSAVATTFTRDSFGQGLAAFTAYALGMGTFLAALAVLVALFGPPATRRLRFLSRFVPRLGGLLLVAVGAYLTLYWTTVIASPGRSPWPLRLVESLQGQLTAAVSAHELVITAVFGGIVVSTLVLLGLFGAKREESAETTRPRYTTPRRHPVTGTKSPELG